MKIDALMQRVAGVVSDDTARFDGPGRGCHEWAAWAIADVMLSRGEHRRCAQWLSVALRLVHREPDLVWQAEYSTTAGALALADGEPAGARSFLRAGFDAWQAIGATFGSPRGLAIGSSVEALVRSLLAQCDEPTADIGPEMIRAWLNDRFVPRTLLAGRLLMIAAATLDDAATVEAAGAALLEWLPGVLDGASLGGARADVLLLLGKCHRTTADLAGALLHYVATETDAALATLLARIERDSALWRALESHCGPGAADPAACDAALRTLSGRERDAFELFTIRDAITSELTAVDRAHAERGLAIAERLGADGARCRFALLVAGADRRAGALEAAKARFVAVVEALLDHDRDHAPMFAIASQQALALAQATSDDEALARVASLIDRVGRR